MEWPCLLVQGADVVRESRLGFTGQPLNVCNEEMGGCSIIFVLYNIQNDIQAASGGGSVGDDDNDDDDDDDNDDTYTAKF